MPKESQHEVGLPYLAVLKPSALCYLSLHRLISELQREGDLESPSLVTLYGCMQSHIAPRVFYRKASFLAFKVNRKLWLKGCEHKSHPHTFMVSDTSNAGAKLVFASSYDCKKDPLISQLLCFAGAAKVDNRQCHVKTCLICSNCEVFVLLF